ncbi:hypothetical protein Acsp01_51840 [Actinoplanes sp. NBRC 101535]|nr:hypothetical protein Acsp01_51840 [Actinoplanes sp. NBRC 101535]
MDAATARRPLHCCGSSRLDPGKLSGFCPILAADCRAGERICIPIRLASRKQSDDAPSGERCALPVLLTPVC